MANESLLLLHPLLNEAILFPHPPLNPLRSLRQLSVRWQLVVQQPRLLPTPSRNLLLSLRWLSVARQLMADSSRGRPPLEPLLNLSQQLIVEQPRDSESPPLSPPLSLLLRLHQPRNPFFGFCSKGRIRVSIGPRKCLHFNIGQSS